MRHLVINARKGRNAIVVILIIQLIVGLLTIQEMPLFENNSDEIGHLNMVRFIGKHGRVPNQSDIEWNTETLQFTQPPLYYFAVSPLLSAIDDGEAVPGQPNPFAICSGYNRHLTNWARPQTFSISSSGAIRAGYLLRAVQLALALVVTWFTYRTALLLAPGQPVIALSASALIAFFPSLTRTTTYIGNDLPVILIGAIALYVTIRSLQTQSVRLTISAFVIVLTLSFMATLTKVTGWAVFILIMPILWQLFFTRLSRKWFILFAVGVLSVVLMIIVINVLFYDSIIGRYPSSWLNLHVPFLVTLRLASLDLTNSILLNDRFSEVRIAYLQYINSASLVVVGTALLVLLLRSLASKRLMRLISVPLLLILASLALMLVRNITAVNEFYIFAPFRYLGPAIPALAILCAIALSTLPMLFNKLSFIVPAIWLGLSFLLATMSQTAVVQRLALLPDMLLPSDAVALDVDQSNMPLQIMGYALAPSDTFADGVIDLTLYLSATQDTTEQLAMLELAAGSSPCRFIPANGFRPNTGFAPGDWAAVSLRLPYCGPAQEAAIPVTVTWRNVSSDSRRTEPIQDTSFSLYTFPPEVVQSAPGCQRNIVTFDNMFQIIKVNLPETHNHVMPLVASVDWLSLSSTETNYMRTYLLKDSHENAVARCEGIPRLGTYAFTRWYEGEVIFDDRCVFSSQELKTGNYALWIGLVDPTTGRYLAHDQSEADFAQIGVIAVE